MSIDGGTGYPLSWPADRPRTPAHKRKRSRFDTPLGQAVQHVQDEIRRSGGTLPVISSNMPGYDRGGVWRPYADSRQPDDPAVAVYFMLDTSPTCVSCDQYDRVECNLRGVGLTLASLRALSRYGADNSRAAFQGFRALPPASDWRTVFRLENPDMATLKRRYRELAASAHPDRGGSTVEMAKLNEALEAAKVELSPPNDLD